MRKTLNFTFRFSIFFFQLFLLKNCTTHYLVVKLSKYQILYYILIKIHYIKTCFPFNFYITKFKNILFFISDCDISILSLSIFYFFHFYKTCFFR